MTVFYVLLGLIVLTVGGVISIYDKLVKLKTLMEEGWSISYKKKMFVIIFFEGP